MKHADFIKILNGSKRWKVNSYGHYHLKVNESEYRMKIQDNSVRFEKKVLIVDKNEWRKIASDYYKNITVDLENKTITMGGKTLKVL